MSVPTIRLLAVLTMLPFGAGAQCVAPITRATSATPMTPAALPVPIAPPAVPSNGSGNTSLSSGLVSYWKFDDASGSSAVDSMGSNTGAWNGTLGSQWTTGEINGGGNYNGSNNYVAVPTISITGDVTFSVWVKLSSNSVSNYVRPALAKGLWGADANGDIRLELRRPSQAQTGTGQWAFEVQNGGTFSQALASSAAPTGVWVHLVGVKQGTTSYLYQNGVQVATASVSGAFGNNSHLIEIGAYPNQESTTALNGVIDEVGIWNRALSASEVATLYNSGSGNPFGNSTCGFSY